MIIRNWKDLDKYGIIFLTGESDPYGLRGLCDFTTNGAELLRRFFGLADIKLYPNWNSRGNGGSCLLAYSMFEGLAKFILFDVEKAIAIVETHGEYHGVFEEEKLSIYKEYLEEGIFHGRILSNPNPEHKERNTHQFSGRTV